MMTPRLLLAVLLMLSLTTLMCSAISTISHPHLLLPVHNSRLFFNPLVCSRPTAKIILGLCSTPCPSPSKPCECKTEAASLSENEFGVDSYSIAPTGKVEGSFTSNDEKTSFMIVSSSPLIISCTASTVPDSYASFNFFIIPVAKSDQIAYPTSEGLNTDESLLLFKAIGTFQNGAALFVINYSDVTVNVSCEWSPAVP